MASNFMFSYYSLRYLYLTTRALSPSALGIVTDNQIAYNTNQMRDMPAINDLKRKKTDVRCEPTIDKVSRFEFASNRTFFFHLSFCNLFQLTFFFFFFQLKRVSFSLISFCLSLVILM